MPTAVRRSGQWLAVEHIEEVWRVAEAWWRDEPLARTYMRVVVGDGRRVTLFHDDLLHDSTHGGDTRGGVRAAERGWYEQHY